MPDHKVLVVLARWHCRLSPFFAKNYFRRAAKVCNADFEFPVTGVLA